jgi:hypothetical protein
LLTRVEFPKKSASAAGSQHEKNKARDDGNDKKHPVLAIEAQKGKVVDQKVQRPRAPDFAGRISTLFGKDKYFGFKNILFFYFFGAGTTVWMAPTTFARYL